MSLNPQAQVSPSAVLNFEDTERAFLYKTTDELYRSHFLFSSIQSNFLVKIGPPLLNLALNIGLPIRGLVKDYFFDQFCGGFTLEELNPLIQKLHRFGVDCVLDFAVEAQATEESRQRATTEILRSIEFAKGNDQIPFIAVKLTGIGSAETLEKASAGKLENFEQKTYNSLRARLETLCEKAAEARQSIFIDAEESWLQPAIDRLAEEMIEKYNKQRPVVYTTLQMYRHDRLAYLKELHQRTAGMGVVLGVKLVRGAYLEKENKRARQMGYPSPMQHSKAKTDEDYNKALLYILDRHEEIAVCAGSHNEDSNLLLAKTMQQKKIALNHPHVYSSQLYGMSDHITFILAEYGLNVAKYLPYGSLDSVLPYLTRRAQENTAIVGQTSRELALVKKELERRKRNGSQKVCVNI